MTHPVFIKAIKAALAYMNMYAIDVWCPLLFRCSSPLIFGQFRNGGGGLSEGRGVADSSIWVSAVALVAAVLHEVIHVG